MVNVQPNVTNDAMAPSEARQVFESTCQRLLGMSTDEFLRAWDRGEFASDPDLAHRACDVAVLLPLVR